MLSGYRRWLREGFGSLRVGGVGGRGVRRRAAGRAMEGLEPRVLLSGNIFETNTVDGTIGEYTTSGAVVNAALVTGLSNPEGIVVSGSDLFVTNSGNGTIGEYTTSGAVVNANLVTGLSNPTGIAISGSDLFVTNYTNGNVGEYTTAGATVNAALVTGLSNPAGIAITGTYMFVAVANDGTAGGGVIVEYMTSGEPVDGLLVTGLNEPLGVAVSGSDLFVTTYDNGNSPMISEYTTAGAVVKAGLVAGVANFGPAGIAVLGSDLFVANINNGTIGEFSTSGAAVNTALVAGLNGAYGIAVTPAAGASGWVDQATASVVSGWASSTTAGASAVNVRVDIDGVMGPVFAANLARPDLTAVVGSADHGFSMVMPDLPAGPNTVSVYEVPATGPAVLLGTRTVTGPRTSPPNGYIDSVSVSGVSGWVFDPSGGAQSLTVEVVVDGALKAVGTASAARGDLTAVVGSADHGFSFSWSALSAGPHTVAVYFLNHGYNMAVLLGSATVTNHAPVGSVDVADATHVAGWALDPDSPGTAIDVRVDIDGVAGTPFAASGTRNDVKAIYGSADHGFSYTYPSLPLAPGFHRIDVWAVDANTGALTLLGSKTVDTVAAPIGYVDTMNATAVTGWAFDADAGAAPINIEVVVDGVQRPVATANVSRGDLTAVVGSADHGFDYALPQLTVGTHTVSVYAIDPNNENRVLLKSGSVTVAAKAGDPQPIGNVDTLTATQVSGWAFAEQAGASPVLVRVDVDGTTVVSATAAASPRSDVAAVVGSADHGYSFSLSLTADESHVVDVYYIDPQTSVPVLMESELLGTAAPVGWVDVLNATTISGWALDASDGANPIEIRVDVDGQAGATDTASNARSDLTPIYGSPNHGFSIPAPHLAPGLHTIVVRAINPYTLATVVIGTATVMTT